MPKKYTIDDMQQLAKKHGGTCLSIAYVNIRTPLRWQCANGHQWNSTPTAVIQGYWCRQCTRTEKCQKILAELQTFAHRRGGKCLSLKFINHTTKLLWECVNGHHWKATRATIIIRKQWCPVCKQLQKMRSFAAQHNGHCLSTHYINVHTKLLWKCQHGHQWKATPAAIQQGRWCPVCSSLKHKTKHTIEEMQQRAHQHGGRCLSTIYKSTYNPLRWECAKGHQWEAPPQYLLKGRWCPQCYHQKARQRQQEREQERIRKQQEREQERARKRQERKQERARKRQEREQERARKRQEREQERARKRQEREQERAQRQQEREQWLHDHHTHAIQKHEQKQEYPNPLDRLTHLAIQHGGKCLTNTYFHWEYAYRWECAKGHHWRMRLRDIVAGQWCPECEAQQKHTLYHAATQAYHSYCQRRNLPFRQPVEALSSVGPYAVTLCDATGRIIQYDIRGRVLVIPFSWLQTSE